MPNPGSQAGRILDKKKKECRKALYIRRVCPICRYSTYIWCIAGYTGRKDLIAKKKKECRKALYGGYALCAGTYM